MTFPTLFSPIRLGSLTVANRIAMAPMSSGLGSDTGEVTAELIAYYRERARGGTGLIIVEFTAVERRWGVSEREQLSLESDDKVAGHRRLVAAIEAEGACPGLQLQLPGQFADPRTLGGRLPVAPSDVHAPKDGSLVARGLTEAEIHFLVERFADAARLAVQAGYRFIELHGAHSYLLMAFLSPLMNKRTDAWGGDLAGRLRFPLAVCRAVKAAIGTVPLSYRFSATEFDPNGLTVDDMTEVAKRLVDAGGVEVVNVSAGRMSTLERVIEPMSEPEGWRLPMTRRIKQAVDVPVIAVGVRWPATAEAALLAGDADMIALGRPLLADADWPAKASSGRVDDIRPCTNCNWCFDRVLKHLKVGCAENPSTGNELERAATDRPGAGRSAVVVGAGPGGMAAALELVRAGFETTLHEARDTLGGGLISSAAPPLKDKLGWYRDWLERRIAASPVIVRLSSRVDAAALIDARPDLVVVASGANERPLDIPGLDGSIVRSAYDLLMGDATLDAPSGAHAVVYGGGETGCETAEYLAARGLHVSLVTRSGAHQLARSAEMLYRKLLRKRLAANPRIEILAHATVVAVGERSVRIETAEGGRDIAADLFVTAQGRAPGSDLADALRAAGISAAVIGDARQVGRIGDAVHQAHGAVIAAMAAAREAADGGATAAAVCR